MFNGYIKSSGEEAYYRLWPSHRHFSLFVNRWPIALAVAFGSSLVGWICVVGLPLVIGVPIFVATMLMTTLLFIAIYSGHKIERFYIPELISVEKAYNAMPRDKREEYAEFLTECYKVGDSPIVYTQAKQLFWCYEPIFTETSVRVKLNEELKRVLASRKLADEIYNESLKK